MRKALVSFGTGDAAKTLAVALPTFHDYAQRHGYDLIIAAPDTHGRPPAWGKIPLLQRVLRSYEFALWIDSDAIIVDGSADVESLIPADAYQALATRPVGVGGGAGVTPGTGVWALRAGERTQRFLADVWAQVDLIEHESWEQAAVVRLLGWRTDGYPVFKIRRTDWDDGLFDLPREWDVIPKYPQPAGSHHIRHYADESTARRLVEMGTDLAEIRGKRIRYWLGVCHRRSGRFPRATTALEAVLT